MGTPDIKPKKSEYLRRVIDFIFGFKNKRGDLLDYWIYSADGFSMSPQEFYDQVERQMEARKIPSMEIARQEFAQGGMLSEQRLYLRLMRERLAITACAAPFGKIFFFSCRTVYVPALVRLWHILVAILALCIVGRVLIILLGVTFSAIAMIGLLFAVAATLRNASAAEYSDLDQIFLEIPVLSTIYQDWFREDTYYRLDTRNLYLKVLPDLILELAKDTCAEKGFKLKPYTQPSPPTADLQPQPVRQAMPAAT